MTAVEHRAEYKEKNSMNKIGLLPILSVLSVSLTACNANRLKDAVTELNTGTNLSVNAFRAYYDSINDMSRDYYFLKLRFRPESEMLEEEPYSFKVPMGSNGETVTVTRNTGLINDYSQEDIEVRVQTLNALLTYTKGLATLANSDAPAKFEEEAIAIGDNLSAIAARINQLSPGSGSTFSNYAGPISQLGGMVGRYYLEHKKDRDLRQCIRAGSPHVKKLLKLLSTDMKLLTKSVDSLGRQQTLQFYIDYYNDHYVIANKEDPKYISAVVDNERQQFLQEAKESARRIALIDSFQPEKLIETLSETHADVDKLAAGKSYDEATFDELLGDLGSFMSEAKRVAHAAELLRDADKSKQ